MCGTSPRYTQAHRSTQIEGARGEERQVSVLDFNCVVDQLSTACAPTPVYGVRIGKGRKVFGPASGEAQRALP